MDKLLQLLRSKGLTLATAESCTGGMLGSKITAIPGSSDVYQGGVVSYSNDVKHRLLQVPEEMLEVHGAVSWQVAEAMAEGVRNACESDIGIGITGIAGPGSDGTEKPVGLVYIGYCDANRIINRRLLLHGTRDQIRREACRQAMKLIRENLK